MISAQVHRTLVKSPPELWAELSDPASLARHLGELGEIRITRVEPEHKVEWTAEHASGSRARPRPRSLRPAPRRSRARRRRHGHARWRLRADARSPCRPARARRDLHAGARGARAGRARGPTRAGSDGARARRREP